MMLQGWDKLADAVSATLGPKGRNVVIEQSYGAPKITKDGVTVAKAIELSDRVENCGVQLAKEVASKANDYAGDGTTTATVLGRAICVEGCKAVAAGMNPMDLKRGIDQSVKLVVEELEKMSKEVKTNEEIRQVATIASNSDEVIGKMLAEAFGKVGVEGNITIQEGRTLEHELEVVEGCKFDRGYISHYFVNDQKAGKIELEDPLILFYEKKLDRIQPLLPILEKVVATRKPLLIIAEDVESEALSTLVVNKMRGGLNVSAVKAPGFGENRKSMLHDLAILTGGQVITEEVGGKLEDAELSMLGTAKRITITKDSTTILEGKSSQAEIDERCEQIRLARESTVSEYECDKLNERLARLQGGVAVIKVGGASEVEVGEIKDRLMDALCATKCAVEEGIVPGGGAALIHACKVLEGRKFDNFDQDIGRKIVVEALKKPCSTIVKNAGKEGAVVVQNIMSSEDTNYGYDAQNEVYTDMVKAGIVDPTKVVRTALVDASSVASLLTTAEIVISELQDGVAKLSPMDKRAMSFGQQ